MDLPKEFRFQSIGDLNGAYRVYLSSTMGNRRDTHDPLAQWAVAYQTYGHALVQHSGEWVVQRESFTDFCASLATHLLSHPDDIAVVSRHWPSLDKDDKIEFCCKLRFDEKKWSKRYNLDELKTSSSDSKRYDRRWEEVPTWADGSFQAVCGLLKLNDAYDLFDSMVRWQHIFERYEALTGSGHCWAGLFAEHFKLAGVEPHYPFKAVCHLVQSYQTLMEGEWALTNWTNAVERKRRRDAEKPAEQTA